MREKTRIDVIRAKRASGRAPSHFGLQVEQNLHYLSVTRFDVADGPEVETGFTILMHSTCRRIIRLVICGILSGSMRRMFPTRVRLFLGKSARLLLRTHTSPVQVRYGIAHPPFVLLCRGGSFAPRQPTRPHEHTFYQFESLFVDADVRLDTSNILRNFFGSRFFGKHVGIRLRPSYFPFVEPGFEFDIALYCVCDGKGVRHVMERAGPRGGGAGMASTRSLEAAGYDCDRWKGFAWGFGTNRLAMMKYKIPDVRLFRVVICGF